jgi:undecaprenyl-diphosphatase
LIFNTISKRLGLAWTAGLIAALGSLLFLGWLASRVVAGETQRFDKWIGETVHSFATPLLTSFMIAVTMLGANQVLLAVGAIAVIAFLLAKWRTEAVLLLVTMAGAGLLNRVLKVSFQRPRPQPYFDLIAPTSYSFPSGHALLSFCFYGAIALALVMHLRNSSARVLVWILMAGLVLLIGASRVYLGVHYASDVIAGFFAAFIWLIAVNGAADVWRRRTRR